MLKSGLISSVLTYLEADLSCYKVAWVSWNEEGYPVSVMLGRFSGA